VHFYRISSLATMICGGRSSRWHSDRWITC